MKHTSTKLLNHNFDPEDELLNIGANYLSLITQNPESFLNELAVFSTFDFNNVAELETLKTHLKSIAYQNVILIGIGGSSLGVWAYYKAFKKELKNLYVLDTVDEDDLNRVFERTTPENSVVVFVSKSGHTLETLTNFEVLEDKGYIIKDRTFAVVSESCDQAEELKNLVHKVFYISEHLSGRYSFFSYVGMLPVLLLGGNYKALLKSANACLEKAIKNPKESEAVLSAIELFNFSQEGRVLYNNFSLDKELLGLTSWYRQLYSESVGKDTNKNPLFFVLNSSTSDYHSVLQMYFSSAVKQVFNFVGFEVVSEFKITKPVLSKFLDTENLTAVRNSLNVSVAKTADGLNIPCRETLLEKTSEDFACFMVTKILEVMVLCKLVGANAFNQPNIESYKKDALKLLKH